MRANYRCPLLNWKILVALVVGFTLYPALTPLLYRPKSHGVDHRLQKPSFDHPSLQRRQLIRNNRWLFALSNADPAIRSLAFGTQPVLCRRSWLG